MGVRDWRGGGGGDTTRDDPDATLEERGLEYLRFLYPSSEEIKQPYWKVPARGPEHTPVSNTFSKAPGWGVANSSQMSFGA